MIRKNGVDDLQEVRRLNPGPGVRGLMSIIYVFFFVRSLWNHRAPQFPRGGKGGIAELFREENYYYMTSVTRTGVYTR